MPINTGPVGDPGIISNITYPSTSGITAASGYVTYSTPITYTDNNSWHVIGPSLTGTDPTYIPPKSANEIEIKDIKKGMFIAAIKKNAIIPTDSETEPLEVLNVNDPFVLAQTFSKKVISMDKNNYKFIKLNDEYVKIMKDVHENETKKANKPKMERALEL